MKQVIFALGELSIVCTIPADLCVIYKNGVPLWAGSHQALIRLLKSL